MSLLIARRARAAADLIDAAEAAGLPIPTCISLTGFDSLEDFSFYATAEEFAAWSSWLVVEVEEYDHDGKHWWKARAERDYLRIEFTMSTPLAEVVPDA